MNQPSQETIYYQDATGLTITSARAIYGPKTFYLANLTSVSISEISVNKIYPSILMTVGIIIFLAVLPQFRTSIDLNSLTGMGLAAICLVGAFIWFRLEKPYYALKLGSHSGELDLLKSKDQIYLQTIATAINQAVLKQPSL